MRWYEFAQHLAAKPRCWLDRRSDCALCEAGNARDGLCAGCRGDLPWLPAGGCPRCAEAVGDAALCGRCISDPPAFDTVIAAVDYRFPIDAMIQRFKFGGELWLAPVLARLLVERLSHRFTATALGRGTPGEGLPDCLLPMPLSAARLTRRGFNPAVELARVLARHSGLPLRLDLLRRVRDAPAQSSLPIAQRAGNVRSAFITDRPVGGLHLALIDDVLTTGATASEAAAALRRQGAARVEVWVAARTLRQAAIRQPVDGGNPPVSTAPGPT